PPLHNALEPKVEHVMEVEVAQKHTDRSALRGSLFARMDRSVFQDARFQPAPDQTDRRGSPTRCSTNRRTQSCLRLPKKFFKSASSTQLIMPPAMTSLRVARA